MKTRSRVLAMALMIAVSIVGCDDSPAEPAAVEVDRGWIVFPTRQIIWRVRPDGTGLKALGRDGRNPILSPDHQKLAFEFEGSRTATSNFDGSGFRFAREGFAELEGWVDDRTLLLNVGDTIAIVSIADSSERVLRVSDGSGFIIGAAVSADGEWLAVSTYEQGIELLRVGGVSAPTRLGAGGTFSSPRFSPDGSRIVAIASSPFDDVAILDVASGAVQTVRPVDSAFRYRWPAWSPDGDSLLVDRYRGIAPFLDQSDLVVVSLSDATTRTVLEGTTGATRGPHWQGAP